MAPHVPRLLYGAHPTRSVGFRLLETALEPLPLAKLLILECLVDFNRPLQEDVPKLGEHD